MRYRSCIAVSLLFAAAFCPAACYGGLHGEEHEHDSSAPVEHDHDGATHDCFCSPSTTSRANQVLAPVPEDSPGSAFIVVPPAMGCNASLRAHMMVRPPGSPRPPEHPLPLLI